MKVLHAAYQRFWSPGIANQMLFEQRAADTLALPWHSRLFMPQDTAADTGIMVRSPHKASDRSACRRSFIEWVEQQHDQYDVLLLRHSTFDIGQARFLRRSRRPVFLVHHTLEVPELRSNGGGLSLVKAWGEEWLGRSSLARASGIVAVTQEIASYEQRRIPGRKLDAHIYPNGIIVDGVDVSLDRRDKRHPTFIFVASHFAPWHGLDRLIEAARNCDQQFTIHLVGTLSQSDLEAAGKDPRFVIHGSKTADFVRKISDQCWLGLSSFALDRKKMVQACTLKVREYLVSGLPVYAGHGDVFPEDFPYYVNGECDMSKIISYGLSMLGASPTDVAQKSRPYIDKRGLLSNLYGELSATVRS